MAGAEGGEVVVSPQDNLKSVLGKVGLLEHLSLFKVRVCACIRAVYMPLNYVCYLTGLALIISPMK